MPDEPTFFSEEHKEAFYDGDNLEQRYEYDDGVLICPVAGPPGTSPEFIQVHGGVGKKKVRYMARRVGARASLPRPQPSSGNEIRLAHAIIPEAPRLPADGTSLVYQVSVVCEFGFLVFPQAGYRMGRVPHTSIPSGAAVISDTDFKTDML